jgi:choline-glycine betaine transporter
MVLISLFFISSADSASMVLGMLSQRGTLSPARWMVALWGISIAGVAAALTLAGGLQVMQSATILVATPFLLVLVAIGVNLVLELRREPYTSTLDPQVRHVVLAHARGSDLTLRHELDHLPLDGSSRQAPLARH